MSHKIKTQLPDPNTFTDALNAHCSGKWFVGLTLLLGVGGFAMGNLKNELSQWSTLYLLIFCCVYLLIPAWVYMKGYYWFFVNSWLVGLGTVILFTYAAALNLHRLGGYINHFNLYIYAITFIVFVIEVFEKRKKLITYKKIINKSISDRIFYVERWLNDLVDSGIYQGMSFALWVGSIIGLLVIIVGTIFGGGLMTAKFLLDSGFDIVVEIVIGFGMFVFSMVVLSRFTHETLKIVAAYQVKKELNKHNI